jgi:hypothetical protein
MAGAFCRTPECGLGRRERGGAQSEATQILLLAARQHRA